MLARLMLAPRHAGQPGARAKTCWRACCPRPGVRPKTPGASLVTTCWPAGVRAKTRWARLVFWPRYLVLVPRDAGHSSARGGPHTLVFAPRHAGAGAKTCWPAWCSCQDACAKTCCLLVRAKTCCQPGGCAKTSVLQPAWCSCQDTLACLDLVPRAKTCGQPGPCQDT